MPKAREGGDHEWGDYSSSIQGRGAWESPPRIFFYSSRFYVRIQCVFLCVWTRMNVGGTEKSWAELEQAELVYRNGEHCNARICKFKTFLTYFVVQHVF